ncbi:ParB N-terminal domain-containing protein [Erysipelothrix urinaevulpis]|uniref:ParB N-terminal domain-containing protein n=1 Tax=Erysipelothrix urinaevulpis TaxID=2683717 RepID=UPI00135A1B16|nr:ParB N-terminal domain-containing protein [Erysipelothrix urinaevulpis]
MNPDKVNEYANKLMDGEKLPPIEVYEVDGKGLFISEGHHRYVASQQTGIPVDIRVLPGGGPVGLPNWLEVQWKNYISEGQFWGD